MIVAISPSMSFVGHIPNLNAVVMRQMFRLILLSIILVVAAIFLLPVFLSTDVVRDKVVEQLSEWTGKEITLTGPAELTVFPNLSIVLQGLSIANSKDPAEKPLVSMDGLTARVHLLPLLTGNIVVDQFVMIRPRMELTINADGKGNWEFGGEGKEASESASQSGGSELSSPAQSFQIGLIEIRDGRIKYQDLATGSTFEATAINTEINWPNMSSPLVASGSLVWDGEVVTFDGEIADAFGFVSGNSSQTKLTLSASPIEITLSGLTSTAADFAMDGDLVLHAPSLRSLARWVGVDIPARPGLGTLSLNTHFTVGGNKISLSETKVSLDGNVAEGAVTFKMVEDRNYIQATLALATLDINPYLAQQTSSTGSSNGSSGENSGNSWSRESFDFSALNFIDADLRISAGRILAADLDLGSGAFTASLQRGRIATELVDIEAYDGQVNGTVVINARSQVPSMTAKINVSEANLSTLLADVAEINRLQGIGNLAIDVAASGNSQLEIIRTLSGQVDTQVTNGKILGIDVAQLLQAYQQRKLEAVLLGVGGETPFDFLEATFAINQGVARNENLMIEAPNYRIAGAGTVDIVNQTLDYRMRAALIEPGSGNDAAPTQLFEIPLIVRGPWSGLRIVPDAAGIFQEVTGADETVNEVGEALRQGDLDAAREAVEKGLEDGESGVRSLLEGILGQPNQ